MADTESLKYKEEFRSNEAQHTYVREQGRRMISKICRDAINEKITRDKMDSLEKLQTDEKNLLMQLENNRKDQAAVLARKAKEEAANAEKSEHAEKIIENLIIILSDYNYRCDRIPKKVLNLFSKQSGRSENELKEILIKVARKKGVKI